MCDEKKKTGSKKRVSICGFLRVHHINWYTYETEDETMANPCPDVLPPTVLFTVDAQCITVSQCAPSQPNVVVIKLKTPRVHTWSSHASGSLRVYAPALTPADFANLWLPNPDACSFGDLAPNAVVSFRPCKGHHAKHQETFAVNVTGAVAPCDDLCGTITLVGRLVDPANPPWGCRKSFVCGECATVTVDGAALDPTLLPQ